MRSLAALTAWARREADAYRGDAHRPLGGYLAVLGWYAGGTGAGAVWAAVRRRGRPGGIQFAPWDVVQMAVATHKLSRMIAKDAVLSPLRAPFTRYQGLSAPGELAEEVRGDGWRHSVGELLTCPMCLGQWVATGLGIGMLTAPRAARVALAIMTAVAGADFLQHGYVRLQQSTEQQG
jgi:hypothetical protein